MNDGKPSERPPTRAFSIPRLAFGLTVVFWLLFTLLRFVPRTPSPYQKALIRYACCLPGRPLPALDCQFIYYDYMSGYLDVGYFICNLDGRDYAWGTDQDGVKVLVLRPTDWRFGDLGAALLDSGLPLAIHRGRTYVYAQNQRVFASSVGHVARNRWQTPLYALYLKAS